MSIIEKAVGRLGPASGGGVNPAPAEVHASGMSEQTISTDKTVERAAAIDARVVPAATSTAKEQPVAESAKNLASTRSVEIDIAQLHKLGMVTPDAVRTSIAEEFRLIKRPLLEKAFSRNEKPIKHANLIMVSSALPGEGKTFCAVNLAISMAMELDHTVLLIDADVARPSLPRYLNLKSGTGTSEIGLLDVLLDDKLDLADAMQKTNIDALTILRAGTSHPRATELLASQSMSALLDEISSRYHDRIIIFDSPPLLLTSEARVLATQMGQIVLVVAAETTTQHAVKEVLKHLKACSNVNLVYNKTKTLSNGDYYGSYYN